MRLYKAGNYILPVHDGRDRLGQTPRSSIVNLRNGSYDNDGNELVLQPNRLSRNVIIISNEDIDDTLFDLTKQMSYGRQLLTARLVDNVTEWHTFGKLTRLSKDANAQTWTTEYPITLEWLQDYPYWIDTSQDFDYTDMGLLLDSGLLMDAGQSILTTANNVNQPANATNTLPNPGGSVITRCYISVISGGIASDVITNLKITNETNGYFIQYNGILSNDNRLDIDCLSKTALLDTTTNAYGNIEIGSNQMEWMKLELGNNALRVTSTMNNGSTYIIFYYASLYL